MKATERAGFYIPGCAAGKLLMVVFGLVLFALGMQQLPWGLLVFGRRATAEAVAVIKTKEGLPDVVLGDDLQIQASLEPHDLGYVFWNQFRFRTPGGQVVDVRAPVGSHVKPLYPLLDADGLPTTDRVYYDPGAPEKVVFPLIISTWFAPGMLALIGLLAAIIGSVLFYWADKPIALPHIPTPEELAAAAQPTETHE